MEASARQGDEGFDRPRIAISMGDPLGIGPEVVAKALSDPEIRRMARFVVHGMAGPMHAAAELAGIEANWWRVQHDSPLVETSQRHDVVVLDSDASEVAAAVEDGPDRARPTRAGGEASFQFVERAIADAKRPEGDPRRVDAIVTAPISKQSWAMAGRGKYAGHTELLTTRFGVKRSAMMFVAPQMKVILATVHIPLMDLRNALTIGRVFDPIDLGNDACIAMGIERPRIAVCGVNPHAGEGGLFGDEETRLIEPAIRMAVDAGIDASGPYPADTVFNAALARKFDLVVAMYHDQGLIPVKLLARDEAVNMTVGLPVVRTSPDHGTAFDIAGKNLADPGSMKAAIALAAKMASVRAPVRNR
ncbi:MAG: 4-hydroxythreonine-4-phosphate dehydrogenase PdxA [Planctomycetota bacterium]|nr:4-hydroxythreonine-4-phosphate dehydrogenase PdxA [Planctomycetota bacterium]